MSERTRLLATGLPAGAISATRAIPLTDGWSLAGTAPGALASVSELTDALDWQDAVVPGTVAASIGPSDLNRHPRLRRLRLVVPAVRSSGRQTQKAETAPPSGSASTGSPRSRRSGSTGSRSTGPRTCSGAYEVDVTDLIDDENEVVIVFRSLDDALEQRRPRPRWKTKLVDPTAASLVQDHPPGPDPRLDAGGRAGRALATGLVGGGFGIGRHGPRGEGQRRRRGRSGARRGCGEGAGRRRATPCRHAPRRRSGAPRPFQEVRSRVDHRRRREGPIARALVAVDARGSGASRLRDRPSRPRRPRSASTAAASDSARSRSTRTRVASSFGSTVSPCSAAAPAGRTTTLSRSWDRTTGCAGPSRSLRRRMPTWFAWVARWSTRPTRSIGRATSSA